MAQPISIPDAERMIETYMELLIEHDMEDQTHSVTFPSAQLLDWMKVVSPFTDEFRICMGVYPPEHEYAGRITTIIWPYNSGSPAMDDTQTGIEPFNEGQGRP